MDEALQSQARHLYTIEKLSIRQVACKLGISKNKAHRLISTDALARRTPEPIIRPYEGLIHEWYREYPFLQAIQVYERLREYGFTGGYTAVKEYTIAFREKKSKKAYHELEFLPGQEAQVDWMQRALPFGVVYGFVYLLSYSRYLYVKFYLRNSMEFFLDGHMEAFRETGGVPGTNRYDNLKSVVISRKPELTYNARFLDFAMHYGFSLYACNPGKANEKGRVERVIRDIGAFIGTNTFGSIEELNNKVGLWRIDRNNRIHRTTGVKPADALKKERLKGLPQIPYRPYRAQPAVISTTGFVYFDTNRYSVPSSYSEQACDILAYPRHIEIVIKDRKIAAHPRSFQKKTKIESPSHREKLLETTPNFKQQRIYQLMKAMHQGIEEFLKYAEAEGQEPMAVAYGLFKLLRGSAKETIISAVKEALGNKIYKLTYVQSLLMPSGYQNNPVHPQDTGLLSIDYEGRDLGDYDELI
jgi:transposase